MVISAADPLLSSFFGHCSIYFVWGEGSSSVRATGCLPPSLDLPRESVKIFFIASHRANRTDGPPPQTKPPIFVRKHGKMNDAKNSPPPPYGKNRKVPIKEKGGGKRRCVLMVLLLSPQREEVEVETVGRLVILTQRRSSSVLSSGD